MTLTCTLTWCPADMCGGPGWSLRAGTGMFLDFGGEDLPRDTDPAELADLVAAELGWPVALTPDTYQWKPRRIGRPRREPFYHVTPVGGQ